jgi:myo-inositol-1(or 4)-monophosphatase
LQAPDTTVQTTLIRGVEAAVREAGAIAAAKFQTSQLKTWTKDGGSPVSEADIAVDKFLRQRLMALAPDAGWLSEESEDDRARMHAPRLWVVDPIDGTRAYVTGRTDWSISVALVTDGRPVIAAIFAPMQKNFYAAAAGEAATLNGAPIHASAGADFAGKVAAGPKPMLERLAKAAPALVMEPKVFSLALRIARVADGTLDISFASRDSHEWDLAAADLLVHQAGGALTTFEGGPLIYNRAEPRHGALVAAGRTRHDAFLGLIRNKTLAFA